MPPLWLPWVQIVSPHKAAENAELATKLWQVRHWVAGRCLQEPKHGRHAATLVSAVVHRAEVGGAVQGLLVTH